MSTVTAPPRPWYKEPWPWILMSGPAIVVVAGLGTAALAVRSDDGLVADDYYKQGLAINRVLAREDAARALGLRAALQFNPAHDHVRVRLEGDARSNAALRLTLVHATHAGHDQAVALEDRGGGIYEGLLHPPGEGVWRLQLQDARATWRLTGHWRAGQGGATLGAASR